MATKIFKKLLQDIAEEHGYDNPNIQIQAVTSGGANYTSNLHVINISAPYKEGLKLFAKVANLGTEFRTSNTFLANVYKAENMFYTELAVNFERIYNKNNVPREERLNYPKCYGHIATESEETLVFEHLDSKGYKSYDRMKTFNWEYASKAVDEMAKFHAISIALREENPKYFEDLISSIEVDMVNQDQIKEMFVQAVTMATELMQEEFKERLHKYFSGFDHVGEMMKVLQEDKTVIAHGDFRLSNLMHRRKNGKIEIMVLDFQTYRRGNPVVDLLQFILSGSDEEFRKYHFDRIVEHYYSQLSLALQRLQIQVEDVYPRKSFNQHIKDYLPFGMMLAFMIISLMTVEPEEAPVIRDTGLEGLLLKPNDAAQERLNGIIRDYARWGVI